MDQELTLSDETEVIDPEEIAEEKGTEEAAPEVDLEPPTASESLRYFGVDFDVDGLVRRFRQHELIIPRFDPEETENEGTGYAGFQRSFVWKKKQMDRFIESILLGYPVPGIFLVELTNRKYIVLDGQQRLTTLRDFFDGQYTTTTGEHAFKLDYVGHDSSYFGKSYEELHPDSRRLLNNALIQATVCLPIGERGKLAVYTLFERINSGGTKLNDQQIRVAIFTGSATKLVRKINSTESWRTLFGPRHRDLLDQQLVLRCLALHEVAAEHLLNGDVLRQYKAPMATFISDYLDRHEVMAPADASLLERAFDRACELLVNSRGPDALRKSRVINAARADSIIPALMIALSKNPALDKTAVNAGFEKLTNPDSKFNEYAEKSTSHRTSVNGRLRAAIAAFSE